MRAFVKRVESFMIHYGKSNKMKIEIWMILWGFIIWSTTFLSPAANFGLKIINSL